MTTRVRKLTAVGLPARDELIVRTLLKVVNTRTTDAWSFDDSLEANVALCNPDSALSVMAIKRATSHGLVCVSVVHEGGHTLPETLTLHAPIRSGDFIDLLNNASGQLQQHARTRRSISTADTHQETLARTLRHIASLAQTSFVRIHIDDYALVVALKTSRIGSQEKLTDDDLTAIGRSHTFRMETLGDAEGEAAMAHSLCNSDLVRLWWLSSLSMALHESTDAHTDRRYQLRRWPDAGRLPLQSFQLHMSAALVRHAMTANELADKVGCPQRDALAFINACGMLGLLTDTAATSTPMAPAHAPVRTSRYGELFQSFRAALGIRS